MPKYLDQMIKNIENGKTVSGKPSNWEGNKVSKSLHITKEENRFLKVVHFGTTILDLDFWGEEPIDKVTYVYMQSKTDAMIINAILTHYNLAKYFNPKCSDANGASFTIKETGEDVYAKWQ